MRVLVGVDVRDGNAGRLNLADLRRGFGGDLPGVHASSDRTRGEGRHAVAEVGRSGDREKVCCRKNRPTIGEDNMAANAQFWKVFCQLCGFQKSQAVRHQG